MSYLLWKYFYDDEIERFRKLLANASHGPQYTSKSYGGGTGGHSLGSMTGSPGTGAFSTSPRVVKNRKVSGNTGNIGQKGANQTVLNRSDINSRDYAGVPLLCRIASSKSESATDFGMALIEHPAIDLYAQDIESGWTALHRALYFGNIALARAIIEKDSRSPGGLEGPIQRASMSVIKVKDREGNSPFDVYNATIARRSLKRRIDLPESDDSSQGEEETIAPGPDDEDSHPKAAIDGDEIFAWGSSKNYNLGFGDEDDRQYPEKVHLKRPDHLLFRFFREYLESIKETDEALYTHLSQINPKAVSDLPTLVSSRPIIVQDVVLSKLHSAILTSDPESNLFMCGFGPGGRLGTGDEVTRFSYVCVEGGLSGRKIVQVALGHSHSLAVDSQGDIFSWGQNHYGVLGYSLPRTTLKDDDPICSTPRQIFGPLKRETIIGVAASAIHSVAHTSTSLFTWGRNEGQLGLMDSDSRSLEVQSVPRKVAASLFKAPIKMVAAINRATIVLLENHTVCVFTNYGYNIVKLPANEGFRNYHLQTTALTTRYDAPSSSITNITAAGDTIAAYSTQSLFTINVRQIDTGSTTSTTNPSKIKDSLTLPQRVWSLRKGHWDGIKSASVTENGSVIICTQAGVVWRRVKRTKVKDAFASAGSFHSKDFKFQRVPGLTKVAAVRSTAYGVYAAIRKDCDVTKTQIGVDEQGLWEDIQSLLCLRDFQASNLPQESSTESLRVPGQVQPEVLPRSLKAGVLGSTDLETDISRHLLGVEDDYDAEITSTTSEVQIPVHGFMLGRSSVLRSALSEFRHTGAAHIPDLLTITSETTSNGARMRVTFQGLDFFTILNLAIYLYTDTVVDVWHFTRRSPQMAFRFRQVRVELMKTAANLQLAKLESAVRLMTTSDRRMDVDMKLALQDPSFFEDADVIIELDGSEMAAHSALLCQRCPFFEGLFHGRAAGQWLAGRRDDDPEAIRIDLKHVHPEAFRLVLLYLYADVGVGLFDDVVAADIDEFSDLVMDVLAVSNELMLDRLSQTCQEVLGRFGESANTFHLKLSPIPIQCVILSPIGVLMGSSWGHSENCSFAQSRDKPANFSAVNIRNVCHLLNAVAPCSVTEFKNSALEYVCLQLESMLENHWLNDLDEGLVLELESLVRANQLACLPFVKSGRAELLLHERHPSLAGDIDEERQRRNRDMAFRAKLKSDDSRFSSPFRVRIGTPDDATTGSPSEEKARGKPRRAQNEPFSPTLRPKNSALDLMFDMEDDGSLPLASSKHATPTTKGDSANLWEDTEPSYDGDAGRSLPHTPASPGLQAFKTNERDVTPTKIWSSPALPSAKLDMRDIMAQASSGRGSNLSMNLSLQKAREEKISQAGLSKPSQKERKKQQQRALEEAASHPQITLDKADGKPASPWLVAPVGPKTSLKDVLEDSKSSLPTHAPKSLESPAATRPLSVRRAASPDTRFAGQSRNVSSGSATKPSRPSAHPSGSRVPSGSSSKSNPIAPHSTAHTSPATRAEPSLQLSMADIIGQQRREQEVIKEAVAKRSLQEIQEEQAFQEWWDQESRRAQQQEAARTKAVAAGSGSGSGRGGKSSSGRGKSGGRGRGGKGRGGGDASPGRGRGG
ncbi:RCC1 protein [Venustampulla echinocandica]|uniref:RCC1 protein n=1 Tax=Venustampulla echinocandica TaxID=2656787 RepID=A0A370TM27_9HELO|nr:RCC1 protein [Venustampulla echinocandica]RDL36574.1 RCC1 protein [Venustampulla echinocandica]